MSLGYTGPVLIIMAWSWWLYRESFLLFHQWKCEFFHICFVKYLLNTAAMLALGAATENAILAAHHLGHEVRLEIFPERAPKQRTVARLDLLEKGGPGTESHRFDHLHASIPLRHSNRKLGQRRALEDSVIESLSTAVSSIPGARLQLLQTSKALQEIGSILGTGDRVRFLLVFEVGPESSEILLFRLAYAEAASARALRRSVADVLSLHAVR
jgi:hypothetical protein